MIQIKKSQKTKFLILVVLPKKKTDYNAKVNEIQGEIPSISGLSTNAALTTDRNKIPNISSLVKKKRL